jgi:hypothetical protein
MHIRCHLLQARPSVGVEDGCDGTGALQSLMSVSFTRIEERISYLNMRNDGGDNMRSILRVSRLLGSSKTCSDVSSVLADMVERERESERHCGDAVMAQGP